jgi:hypothetical protein
MNIENINIPPNSIESEQSVLGGLLLHNEAWDEVADAGFGYLKHWVCSQQFAPNMQNHLPLLHRLSVLIVL